MEIINKNFEGIMAAILILAAIIAISLLFSVLFDKKE